MCYVNDAYISLFYGTKVSLSKIGLVLPYQILKIVSKRFWSTREITLVPSHPF